MLLRDKVQSIPCAHTLCTSLPLALTAWLSMSPCRALQNCHLSPAGCTIVTSGHWEGMMLPGCFGREGLRAGISLTTWPRMSGLGRKSFTPGCAASVKSQGCPKFCGLWHGPSCSSVSCQGHQANEP